MPIVPPPLSRPAATLATSPWFASLEPVLTALQWQHFPDQHTWSRLPPGLIPRNAQGQPIRFDLCCPEDTCGYEPRIWQTGVVATRPGNWHDAFNALCWLAWPKTKAALNALHIAELARQPGAQRSRLRDAATLFDESGLVLACAEDTVAQLLAAHQWQEAFVDERPCWQDRMAPLAIGHALLEKGLAPFKGIVARTLILPVSPDWFTLSPADRLASLDTRVAAAIATDPAAFMRHLQPVPVLGIPGWWPVQDAAFYADQAHFRPKRPVVRRA